MSLLRDRPTPDLIVIFLTGIIGTTVILVLSTSMILNLTGHSKEAGDAITWLGRITNTLVGGVFGYLAGRSVTNGNGKKEGKNDPGSS